MEALKPASHLIVVPAVLSSDNQSRSSDRCDVLRNFAHNANSMQLECSRQIRRTSSSAVTRHAPPDHPPHPAARCEALKIVR